MTPEKLDAKQLYMVDKALPFAPKWAQMVIAKIPGLPGCVTHSMVQSIVYYHIVDQARLYKDKDPALYFTGLQMRLVSLVKETLLFETMELKRDSQASAREKCRVFTKCRTMLSLEGLINVADPDIEGKYAYYRGLLHNMSPHIAKLNKREKEVLYYRYFECLTWAGIGYKLGFTGSRASQIHSKALSKIRCSLHRFLVSHGLDWKTENPFIDRGDIAC